MKKNSEFILKHFTALDLMKPGLPDGWKLVGAGYHIGQDGSKRKTIIISWVGKESLVPREGAFYLDDNAELNRQEWVFSGITSDN